MSGNTEFSQFVLWCLVYILTAWLPQPMLNPRFVFLPLSKQADGLPVRTKGCEVMYEQSRALYGG